MNASTLRVGQRLDGCLLVGVEYFTRLCEVVNMFVGIGLKGLEEGKRCVYEEHALPPACRHRGRERGGGREGEKGVEGGKVAVSVVGRVGRVSAGTTAFPWGQLSTGARAHLFTSPEYMLIRYYLSLSLSSPPTLSRCRRRFIIKYFLDDHVAASTFI